MPPPPPPPPMPTAPPLSTLAIYQCRVIGRLTNGNNQEVVTTMHYKVQDTGPGPATLTQLLSDFRTQWRTIVVPQMPTFYTAMVYQIRSITDRTGVGPGAKLVYGDLAFLNGNGGLDVGIRAGVGGADGLVPYVSWSIEARGFKAGRSSFGVYRLSPLWKSDVNPDQTLTAAGLTAGQGAAIMFQLDISGGVGAEIASPVVFGKTLYLKNIAASLTGPAVAKAIANADVAPRAGSQITRKQSPRRIGY